MAQTLILLMRRLPVVALLMVLALPAFSAESRLEKILSEKKVAVGWVSAPPQEFKDPKTGEVSGYLVDAIKYIFGELGVEVEMVETNWGGFVAALQSGQIDLCIASSFASIKRSAVVDFTRPLLYLGRSAIVRKDEKRFSQLSDLNDESVTIAVLLGSRSEDFVQSNLPKAKVLSVSSNDPSAPFLAVAAGRADAGINDAWAARRYAMNQPSAKDLFGDEPFNVSAMAWTVAKGNPDLLNFLNTSLDIMLTSGKLEELAQGYPNSGRYREETKLVPFAPKADE